MNIMIAAIGVDPLYAGNGTAQGALFIAVLAGGGFLLLAAAGRLSRRETASHAARYTAPRF